MISNIFFECDVQTIAPNQDPEEMPHFAPVKLDRGLPLLSTVATEDGIGHKGLTSCGVEIPY